MKGWLVVFAKAPLPGFVKTRLSPPLSPGEAAELYRCMLGDVLEESARAARALDLRAVLAVEPPQARDDLAARAPADFAVVAQSGADLSQRMSHAARQAAASGAPSAILRGSDSPALSREVLAEAAARLGRCDVVVCPDRDGGYNLVALSRDALRRGLGPGGLFDHPMSTASVLEDTLGNASRLGLRGHALEPGFDIDRFADLRWLARARGAPRMPPCRRTFAFLDERSLWPELRPESGGAGGDLDTA